MAPISKLVRASGFGLLPLLAALLSCAACAKESEEPAAPGDRSVTAQTQAVIGDGFAYGQIIRLSHTSGGAADLTDFQVQVTLDTATEITNGRMRSDCADIRVYAGNGCSAGAPVNFWVADGTCNASNTNIWLGLPSVLASSVNTFAVYWGDLQATSVSNGANVFPIFFDDFNDGVLDTGKWNSYAPSPLTEANGILTNGGGATAIWTVNKVMAAGLTVFGVGTNAQSAGGADIEYGAATLIASSGGMVHWNSRTYSGATFMSYDYGMAFIGRATSGASCAQTNAGSRWANAPGDPTWFQTEFFYEYVANDQTRFGIYDKFGVRREVTLGSVSCKPPATESAYYQWDHASALPNPISSLDYAYVRKYANPQPQVTDRAELASLSCLPNGTGPCTPSTAAAACVSGACSPNASVCIPGVVGACYVDTDCGNGQYCDRAAMACKTKLSTGTAIPTDGLHDTCPGDNTNAACATGLCNSTTSTCAASNGSSCGSASGCVANVCDTDYACGYVSGHSCSPSTSGVCRFSCGASGVCLPQNGCDRDTGCYSNEYCNTQTLGCYADLGNAYAIPADHGACGAADGSAGAALNVCSSGHCNTTTNTCAAVNGQNCSTAASCESNVCGADNQCGYANGTGSCDGLTETVVCRSRRCSVNGHVCIPDQIGTCWVDADCDTQTQFCHRQTYTCTTKLDQGAALPTDGLHNACTASVNAACESGLCNDDTLTCAEPNSETCGDPWDCVSNICDQDGRCGYENGRGTCSEGYPAPQCRSGICGTTDVCIPSGGCAADSDCDPGEYCVVADLQCAPALANGFPIPAGHGTCTAAGTAGSFETACATQTCNATTNTCAGANTTTPCTSANQCVSNICGGNDLCGRDSGENGCTQINEATVCQSGTCSEHSAVCIPSGSNRCWVDDDCATGNFCHRSTFLCTGALPTGSPLPGDGLHNTCPIDEVSLACATGMCNRTTNTCAAVLTTDCTGPGDCVSNVCDSDNKCGYANGNGPCTSDSQTHVCRSGVCNTTGRCIPAGGCGHDSECPGFRYCRASDFSCALDLSNGSPLPDGHGTCGNSDTWGEAKATCASGACNPITNTCAGPNSETTCTAGTQCVNNMCGSNARCGYANGTGSNCTAENKATNCQSGACSAHGAACVPEAGKCWVDEDCAQGKYCHRATYTCENVLASGTSLPDDGLHGSCNGDGTSRACSTGRCDGQARRCAALNGAACTAAENCVSRLCGKNNRCGYDVGEGPCNTDDAKSVCQSGVCAQSGVCIPSGEQRCWVDPDCAEGSYCDRANQTCRQRIASGTKAPDDGLHVACSDGSNSACSTGMCSMDTGLCVASNSVSCDSGAACASSICGGNDKCGLAETEGPCNQDNAADSCQTGKCSQHGNVCITGECWVDADCASNQYCKRSSQSCETRMQPGATLPSDDLHDTCKEDGANNACASGRCENGHCVEPESAFGVAGGGGCSAAPGSSDSGAAALCLLTLLFGLRRGRRRFNAGHALLLLFAAWTVSACTDDDPLAGVKKDAGQPAQHDAGKPYDGDPKTDSGSPAVDAGMMSMPTDSGTMSVQDAGKDAAAPGDAAVDSGPAQDDLDSLEFHPSFEPDYNNLVPQPWVDVATTMQQQTATVHPDKLIFPLAENPEVLNWQPGRVVVSAPGTGSGANPLGFARRVVSVAQVGDTIEVTTETVGLGDIVTGDMQQTLDFDKMVDVDMSKLDLDWAAQNLYLDVDTLMPEIADIHPDDEPLPEIDENGNPVPGNPLFGSIVSAFKSTVSAVGNAVGAAANAVKNTALTVWRAVTPASFTGSASINSNLSFDYKEEMFRVAYKKTFGESGKTPVELSISGKGDIDASVLFKPAAQVGISVPVPGHDTHLAAWMNVDSQFRSRIELGVELQAEIASADNQTGSALNKRLAENSAFAQDVFTQAKERFTGNPDMKPAGGWKRTVFMTRPATQTFFAGPVPVVLTQTFQLDVECGFSAKAALKARMIYERVSNIKFNVRYENGRVTNNDPVFVNLKNRSVEVTGGGSIQVTCGLIPRVNAFVYDSVGVFAGVRGSLVAQASYQAMCAPDPLVSKTSSEVTVGLYGNVGLQLGGRLQAPGSSYAGKAGQKLGTDIGPFEPWNTQFPLYEKVWSFDGGLGYCTPTCRNTMRDGRETDVNCGGGSCNACGPGQMCQKNTDCAKGYCSGGVCSTSPCGDGVLDGDETGIDCGGSCAKCRAGIPCLKGSDCMSGFCAVRPGNGSRFGYCVQDHCSTFAKDADETGLDCGGATCPKCAVGARCTLETDCVSGFRDDGFCVAGSCRDRVKTSNESGIDCGGNSSCRRCYAGETCALNSDCATLAPVCDRTTHVCARPMCEDTNINGDETDTDCGGSCPGCAETKHCLQTSDCATGLECHPTDKVCVTPSCTDTWKNGSETDVDCGGQCNTKCLLNQACQNSSDCDAAAPNCSSMHKCSMFVCPAGQYAQGMSCVPVGVGYWSPVDDIQRYACTNAPANADYTSATATSYDCPWSCNEGYLLNSGTQQCQASATARGLRCASNEVAVGLFGRSGAWLDALGMRCAPFNGTQITGAAQSGASVGGSGGGEFTYDCDANEVLYEVSGINGWSTSSPNPGWCNTTNLSKVQIGCKNLSTGNTRMAQFTPGNGQCVVGGPNSAFDFTCPVNQYPSGVIVDSANTSLYVGKMYGLICR